MADYFGGNGPSSYPGTEDPDNIYGNYGNDVLRGAGGNDYVDGGPDADMLYGDAGDDRIFHGDFSSIPFQDTIDGGAGNDRIDAGYGDDIDGGLDIDTLALDFGGIADAIVANFATLTRGGPIAIGDGSLANIERIAAVTLGERNDVVVAGAGLPGIDRAIYSGNGGDDRITGSNRFGEILSGGEGGDTLFGLGGFDSLFGGGGDDRLDGGGDRDVLSGDAGTDRLFGGSGDDLLDGGNGDDVLTGGVGYDELSGGAGRDRFVFAGGDTGATLDSADYIRDFARADRDKIALTAIDAVEGGADDAFVFIGAAAFGGVAGQLRYALLGGLTLIEGDTDGDGVADVAILVAGDVAFRTNDFLL